MTSKRIHIAADGRFVFKVIRDEPDWDMDGTVLPCVGGFERRRDLQTVFEAFDQLRPRKGLESVTLILTGQARRLSAEARAALERMRHRQAVRSSATLDEGQLPPVYQRASSPMRILVISNGFPPISTTGVHRTVALTRRLCSQGCEVTVLSMQPPPDLPIEQRSLEKVPSAARVIRTPVLDLVDLAKFWQRRRDGDQLEAYTGSGAPPGPEESPDTARPGFKDWLSRWLQVPDRRTGWFLTAAWAGAAEARRRRPDVIYSSAPMWSSHLVGMVLSAAASRPWVADCRDPWRSNSYRSFPYSAHDRFDAWLERKMVGRAAAVICSTAPAMQDFCRRYPDLAGKFVSIPNGYDRAQIEQVSQSKVPGRDGFFRLVHAGVFYGPRSPEPYLEAIAKLVGRRPELRQKIRFVQVGPPTYGHRPMAEVAEQYGVADMLELTGFVPHRRALEIVNCGDVAVAASQVGASAELQIPRKFYEYYGLGKPILLTGGACAAVRELIGKPTPVGLWLVDRPDEEPEDLAEAIEEIFNLWQAGRLAGVEAGMDLTDERMAAEIEAILLNV